MTGTKEVLKKVRKLEIKSKMLVEGLISGAYHSVFKGRGIEFSEVREYVPGDDVRAIDWNVTARMNMPYVKEFIEERDLIVYILFDASASGNFGSSKEKKEAAIELAASLMFAALRNNDNAGLVLFTDKVEKFVTARKGRRHVLRMLSELLGERAIGRGTDIKAALSFIRKVAKRKSIIFIVSDFMGDINYQKELQMLKAKHDVIAVGISDPRESDIPDIGYIELEDEETGEQVIVNTSDSEFRKRYRAIMQRHVNALKRTMSKYGIGLVPLVSGQDFHTGLARFFRERAR
jgi:uncharacterized protein (DUF58 family)